MAKSKEQMQIDNAYGYEPIEEMNARNYHIAYMLTSEQMMFAIAYEVAKQFQISIQEAYQKYNSFITALKSISDVGNGLEWKTSVIIEVASVTTPEKPSIILVNYRIHNDSIPYSHMENLTGAMHWSPVIVTKDEAGQFYVTSVNSSTTKAFQTSEIKNFVNEIAYNLGTVPQDASRDVQISHVCGLASASASGIALRVVSEGQKLERKQFEHGERRKMFSESYMTNTQEIPYCVQGRKTFAVMEYLSRHPNAIEKNVAEVEKLALVECGILTQAQVFSPRNIDDLLYDRETFKFELNKMFNRGPVPSNCQIQKTDIINKLITDNATLDGFNIAKGMRDMERHIDMLWDQVNRSNVESPARSRDEAPQASAVMEHSRDGSSVAQSFSCRENEAPVAPRWNVSMSRWDNSAAAQPSSRREDEVLAASRENLAETSATTGFSRQGSAVEQPLRAELPSPLLLGNISGKPRAEVVGERGISAAMQPSRDDRWHVRESSVSMLGDSPNREHRRGEDAGRTPASMESRRNDSVIVQPLSGTLPNFPLSSKSSRKHGRDETPKASEDNRKRSKTSHNNNLVPYPTHVQTLELIVAILQDGDQSDVIDQHIILRTDLNGVNKSGKTPLMCAAFHGKETYCRKLIEAGADLEIKGPDGKTVLEWAVEQNKLPLIKELLLNGASAKNVKVSIVNLSAYWLLSAYRASPVKWLIDNDATRLQIKNFVRHRSTEELQEEVILGLSNKGDLNVVARILEASLDARFLNNEKVIGVLNEAFSSNKMKNIKNEKLIQAAYFIMEKAHQVYRTAEILGSDINYQRFMEIYDQMQDAKQQSSAHAR